MFNTTQGKVMPDRERRFFLPFCFVLVLVFAAGCQCGKRDEKADAKPSVLEQTIVDPLDNAKRMKTEFEKRQRALQAEAERAAGQAQSSASEGGE